MVIKNDHFHYFTNDAMGGSDGLIEIIIMVIINNDNFRPEKKRRKKSPPPKKKEYEETFSPKYLAISLNIII